MPESGILPWRVGISIERNTPRVNMTIADLAKDFQPSRDVVSVVTSDKAHTKEQVRRLKLIEYLDKRMPALKIYGRDVNTIDDKADALMSNRFHLALENCRHAGHWTEKLSDPVLLQNVTFYSGHNSWGHCFPAQGAIIEIDVANPSRAYETICRTIDAAPREDLRSALWMNKRLLFTTWNIHKAIERAIRSRSEVAPRRVRLIDLPAHRTRRRRLLGLR